MEADKISHENEVVVAPLQPFMFSFCQCEWHGVYECNWVALAKDVIPYNGSQSRTNNMVSKVNMEERVSLILDKITLLTLQGQNHDK